jgi:hypothetical protein
MILNTTELNKIQETLSKFPEVKTFELVMDDNTGIGAILSIKFGYLVNDVKSVVIVEIYNVDNW